MNTSRVCIIVINYKNHSDTIECIESIVRYSNKNVQIILVDNFSENDSVAKILEWLNLNSKLKSKVLTENEFSNHGTSDSLKEFELLFVVMNENRGFAGGNNFIIHNQIDNFQYFLLFNNDAVCVNNVVDIMRDSITNNPEYVAGTCRINHYLFPERLQQMGGELLWFGHFKRYNEKFLNKCLKKGRVIIPVTFATGCVLMIKQETLKRYGLLSSKIFFGEEDVELALRFKQNKLRMASFIQAIVLHKGGAAQKESSTNHIDAGYAHSMIGRSVMLKSYYSKFHWYLWFFLFKKLMTANLIIRRRFGIKRTLKIFQVINKYSYTKSAITKDDFFGILAEFK
jgi:GT2 family glycosyltransferase